MTAQNQVTIVHQKDQGHECWNLDGIGYQEGRDLEEQGWQWLRGPHGGMWTTADPGVAAQATATGIPVAQVGAGHRAQQLDMFGYEVLPLFSGTPQRGNAKTFDPAYVGHQMSTARCRLCMDTGAVQADPSREPAWCWCEAGRIAREKGRAGEQWSKLTIDAASLSSGTIAGLIGRTDYATIEKVQARFVSFCQAQHGDHPGGFATWQEAWAAFAEEDPHV